MTAPTTSGVLGSDDRRLACAETGTDSSGSGGLPPNPSPLAEAEEGARGGRLDSDPHADAPTEAFPVGSVGFEYTGPERRVLDPEAAAFVDTMGMSEAPFLQWRVRAGDTRLKFSSAADADDCAWLHNYMHGHLLSGHLPNIPHVTDAPLPADRRAPCEAPPLTPVDLADPDHIPAHPDEVRDA